MLAQPMPRPIIGRRARYWLVIWDSAMSEIAARPRHTAWTRFAPTRWTQPMRNSAAIMVKKL